MTDWKRKLAAYLHDPPEKAFDIAGHVDRRKTHVLTAFGESIDLGWFFDRICDHTSAAADRFCFPKFPHAASEFTGQDDASFHHPLGAANDDGGKLVFAQPLPSADKASEIVSEAQRALGLEGRSDEDKFRLHWRFWREECASRHPALGFLPADTRIRDHTIWTHAAVTSALQGCVEIEGEGSGAQVKEFRPAFLLMQFGPVQEFISQARSTRDLWSGSYLLSWLVAHAIKTITGGIGPDTILFPALCGQPLTSSVTRNSAGGSASGAVRTVHFITTTKFLRRTCRTDFLPSFPRRVERSLLNGRRTQPAQDWLPVAALPLDGS